MIYVVGEDVKVVSSYKEEKKMTVINDTGNHAALLGTIIAVSSVSQHTLDYKIFGIKIYKNRCFTEVKNLNELLIGRHTEIIFSLNSILNFPLNFNGRFTNILEYSSTTSHFDKEFISRLNIHIKLTFHTVLCLTLILL
jgi:hypothetical protein